MTASGRRKRGIWLRIMPPPLLSPSNMHAFVAERHQVARHGQRGRAGADQAMRLPFFCVGTCGK